MNEKEIKELEEKAKLATPGPWDFYDRSYDEKKECVYFDCFANSDRYGTHRFFIVDKGKLATQTSDASFIVAANPTAILSLIERLRECEMKLSCYPGPASNDYFEKWRRG